MRGNLVLVFSVVALALFAAWVMVPSRHEMAEMKLRDHDYAPAQRYFEEQIAAGNYSADVVGRLNEIYLADGRPDRATALIARYVREHPADPAGERLLAANYQASRLYHEWQSVLERLYATQPSDATARQLAALAMQFGDRDRRTRYLSVLADRNLLSGDETLELANLLATGGDKPGAERRLMDWIGRQTENQRLPADLALLAGALAADLGDDAAVQRLADRLAAAGRPADLGALVTTVAERHRPILAQHLAEFAAARFPDDLRTAGRLAAILTDQGQRRRAFSLLAEFARRQPLPNYLALLYLDLAVSERDDTAVFATAQSLGLAAMPVATARTIVDYAMQHGRRDVVEALDRGLDAAARAARPLLAAELALDLGRADESRTIVGRIDPAALSLADRLDFARIEERLGNAAGAMTLLAGIAENPATPDQALADLGRLYLDLNRAAEGLPLFQRLTVSRPAAGIAEGWALLEAAAGDPTRVVGWLADQKQVPRQFLLDLYYQAEGRGSAALALAAATRLQAAYPGPEAEMIAARAQLAAGHPDIAARLAQPLAASDPDAEDVYLAALARLGDRTQLQTYLLARLADPAMTARRRTDLGYVLNDNAAGLRQDEPGPLAAILEREAGDATLDDASRDLRLALLERLAPGRALAFIASAADRDPARYGPAWIAAMLDQGRGREAFDMMKRLSAAGKLPPALAPPFISLALDRGDTATAFAAATAAGLDALPDDVAVAVIDAAVTAGDIAVLTRLDQAWPQNARDDRPLLAGELDVALGRQTEALRRLDRLAADRGLPLAQQLTLANLYARLGRDGQALAILNGLARNPATPIAALTDLARLYIDVGRAADGLSLFADLRRTRPAAQIDEAWARLAVRAGNPADVAGWIAAHAATLSEAALIDLYYGAADRKASALAADIARRLLARFPAPDNRRRLAAALLADKKPVEAAAALEPLLPGTPEDAILYVEALTQAGRKDRLRAFLPDRLAGPDLSDKQRTDLAWALVNLDDGLRPAPDSPLARRLESDLARPLSEADREPRLALLTKLAPDSALRFMGPLAQANPAKWADPYVALLLQRGRAADAVAFLKADARRPNQSEAARRALASRLLELGGRPAAEALYRDLAFDKPPASPEVGDLLFLWGPAPTPDQLDWLIARARGAVGDDRAAWLRLALERGGRDRVIAFAQSLTPPGGQGRVLEVYADALADARDGRDLTAAIARAIAAQAPPAVLSKMAEAAQATNQPQAAADAWAAILAVRPADVAALRGLGALWMAQGRRREATDLYARLNATGQADWRDDFNYGELLLAAGRKDQADARYTAALGQIAKLGAHAPYEAQLLRAHILHRLGRDAESIAAFDALRRQRPNDRDLLADYAGVLLELGRTDAAAALLRGQQG